MFIVILGFGSLCNESISQENLEKLQVNLVISHACGFGEEVPSPIVKLMLLLKVQSLSYGYSGVQLETVNRLIDFYNEDILPVVYQQGSLGASGDLAPLAHLSLPLLGLGEVYYKGQKVKSEQVLKEMAWKPICLKSKEGLTRYRYGIAGFTLETVHDTRTYKEIINPPKTIADYM